jgi:hypothetical protein
MKSTVMWKSTIELHCLEYDNFGIMKNYELVLLITWEHPTNVFFKSVSNLQLLLPSPFPAPEPLHLFPERPLHSLTSCFFPLHDSFPNLFFPS